MHKFDRTIGWDISMNYMVVFVIIKLLFYYNGKYRTKYRTVSITDGGRYYTHEIDILQEKA